MTSRDKKNLIYFYLCMCVGKKINKQQEIKCISSSDILAVFYLINDIVEH